MPFEEIYDEETGILRVTGSGTLGPLTKAKETALEIDCSGQPFNVIEDNCFQDYVSVTKIILPDTIEIVKDNIIANTNSLKNLNLPRNVREIGSGQSFDWTYSIQNIFVDKENKYFADIDGVLYSKDLKILHFFPGGKSQTVFVVPFCVEKIGIAAFAHSEILETIVIPPTVKEISSWFCCLIKSINGVYIHQCEQSLNFDQDNLFFGLDKTEDLIHYSDECIYLGKNTCYSYRNSAYYCFFLFVLLLK